MSRVLAVVTIGSLATVGCSIPSSSGIYAAIPAPAVTTPPAARQVGEQAPQAASTDRREGTLASQRGTPPDTAPPDPPAGSGGVQGRVTVWPSCPVETDDP